MIGQRVEKRRKKLTLTQNNDDNEQYALNRLLLVCVFFLSVYANNSRILVRPGTTDIRDCQTKTERKK